MSNVLFLNNKEKTLSIDTEEPFNRNILNSLKSILEFQSFKTSSFMLGTYKFDTNNNEANVVILAANEGDIVYDDIAYVKDDRISNEYQDEAYQKIKNLTIIKQKTIKVFFFLI